MQTLQAQTADPAQLALPVREPKPRRRPARPQKLTWGEWCRREAQLYAAYQTALELGDQGAVVRTRSAWKDVIAEIPATSRRRRGGAR